MILDWPRKLYDSYVMEGVSGNFLAFHTVFEPYENSWETIGTLRTPRNSAAKETSSLTSSGFL